MTKQRHPKFHSFHPLRNFPIINAVIKIYWNIFFNKQRDSKKEFQNEFQNKFRLNIKQNHVNIMN